MPAFEAIASTTLTGTSASVTFSSITSAYEHLQIRAYCRTDEAALLSSLGLRLNSDSGSNYAYHLLLGNGSTATASRVASAVRIIPGYCPGSTATANIFGVFVIDILDYASTNKNKTIRSLNGEDRNGAGNATFASGLWMSTSAVTSIEFGRGPIGTANLVAGTVVSLYGLRSA